MAESLWLGRESWASGGDLGADSRSLPGHDVNVAKAAAMRCYHANRMDGQASSFGGSEDVQGRFKRPDSESRDRASYMVTLILTSVS